MNITKFNEKLNKIDGNTYVIEEVVTPVNGLYEAELAHDNVNLTTLNVYTGSKLAGERINTYTTSTPSLAPWKTVIKIYSSVAQLYISYETSGDTVEADDINNVQDAVVETQENLNSEIDRAIGAEKVLTDNLNTEVSRAKSSENTLTNNLNSEITRAKGAESTLTNNLTNEVNRATAAENALNNNLNSEVNRAKSSESILTTNLNSEVTRATNAESILTNNLNSEITRSKSAENTLTNTINTNKPNWDDKYTKNEVDNKISQVVSNMDWKESVGTYADIATTYPTPDDGWTVNVKDTDITYRYSGSAWIPISANSIPLASSSVDGKMSKQDKIDHDDMNSKKHIHSNKGIIDIITQALIDNWNAAYNHISDTVKHITATERTLWNSVSNKSDVGHTHISSNITDLISTIRSCALTGLSTTTNSIISASDTILGALGKLQSQITANLGTLTNHMSNTNNPHSTTAGQIGLGNVTNDSQVKRSEMGAANGVATLDSSGVNNQAPKSHTHDDRYYTETEADNKFATKDQISQAGYGDMLKSIYDTNNDGIVDNADKLDGKHYSDITNDISNAINSLQVGGRNLLLKTGIKDGVYSLSSIVGTSVDCTIAVVDETTAPYGKAITLTRADTTTNSGGRYWNVPSKLTISNVYTWSIWLKGSGTWSVGQEQGGTKNISLTSTWSKYTYTYTANSSTYYQFVFYRVSGSTGGELSFHSLKLEEGNQPTSWTPALEELVQKGMTWNDLEGI